jgi:hypothetical protein
MRTLQHLVDRALDAAVFENGYTDLMGQSPHEVALDLCTYDAALQHVGTGRVEVYVKDYIDWYWAVGKDA